MCVENIQFIQTMIKTIIKLLLRSTCNSILCSSTQKAKYAQYYKNDSITVLTETQLTNKQLNTLIYDCIFLFLLVSAELEVTWLNDAERVIWMRNWSTSWNGLYHWHCIEEELNHLLVIVRSYCNICNKIVWISENCFHFTEHHSCDTWTACDKSTDKTFVVGIPLKIKTYCELEKQQKLSFIV